MNITKIRLAGAINYDLPIVGALPTDSYIFKGADGLGPVEQELFIVNTQNQGGLLQSQRPQTREIVLRIGLNPDWATGQRVEQLRAGLYGTILPRLGTVLKVQLMNGETVLAESVGHVKRCEPMLFSKEPDMQMVIVCPQAYFSAPAELTLAPSLAVTSRFDVINPGTAPSGLKMNMVFMEDAPGGFEITQQGDFTETLSIDMPFHAGDTLEIDTTHGSRRVWWSEPVGENESILEFVTQFSRWPQMQEGLNRFLTDTTVFSWAPAGGFIYTPRYLGV